MIIDEYLKFKPETQAPNFDSTGPMNTPQHMRNIDKRVLHQRRESSSNLLPPLKNSVAVASSSVEAKNKFTSAHRDTEQLPEASSMMSSTRNAGSTKSRRIIDVRKMGVAGRKYS